jgi:FtsP/CotA-like multicopper oxidase with cupredoxin domain
VRQIILVLLVCAASAHHALTAAVQPAPSCATGVPGGPDPDLYCIELLPATGIDGAAGTAQLLAPPSPFGVAVTAAGEHQYDIQFDVQGLPPASALGPYTTYVAWATTPQLHPVVKLGTIGNGRVTLGRIAFDRTLILITAEASAAVTERSGRLVLRGTSAAVRMQPHDLAFLLAGLLDRPGAPADAHAHHTPGSAAPGEWTPPPMHPQVLMPPALMTLRPPDVAPYAVATDPAAPLARPRELVQLKDGAAITLAAAPVRRVLFGRTVTMLGFNGQYPGPLIQVDERSTIHVRFVNRTDFPTAMHWHGVRLDNRFDGAPHVTQDPVPPGGTFDYTIHFPDAGIYWYHPHHREDVLQDLGLYGNLLVRSRDPGFFGPANREEVLILDDLLIGDNGPTQYGSDTPTHALMGRFGNVLLVNGEPKWTAAARRGHVARIFLTNVSSTRVFNLSWQGARTRMKVVASDLGKYEQESWVDNVVIAPAERFVVDVRFEEPGEARLVNRVRAIDHIMARFFEETHVLGAVGVAATRATPDHAAPFDRLRRNAEVVADIDRYRSQFGRPIDHELSITLELGDLPFPLKPLMNFESVYRHPVEWSGTMPEMDWVATGKAARWILRDRATTRENMDIRWRFRVGDVVKLRLVNDRRALHAMQHPIHIHGQRFLVTAVNGVPNSHLVWKDTVLVPTGFTTDVLLELSNPGKWMLHCHVAEHIETGMRMVFEVGERQ